MVAAVEHDQRVTTGGSAQALGGWFSADKAFEHLRSFRTHPAAFSTDEMGTSGWVFQQFARKQNTLRNRCVNALNTQKSPNTSLTSLQK